MVKVKQQSSSYNKRTQKLSNRLNPKKIIINSIENLSNELFYEIFDYLYGIDIYQAFANLNHRFQQILNSSSLRFKIEFDASSDESYTYNYKQITLLKRHQIFSFHLYLPLSLQSNPFYSSFTFDSSLSCLGSLILELVEPDILISFLTTLAYLPRLFSLTIQTWNGFGNLSDIYRLIFALPVLKYNRLLLCGCGISISLPTATDKQMSTIEYLVIGHSCTFNELTSLISYTPQLRYLNFLHTNANDSNMEIMLPMTLTNLTFISVDMYSIMFDEFEVFIKTMSSTLKALNLTTRSEDIAYLDAHRWEQLISTYLPQLKEFNLQVYEHIDYENESVIYLEGPCPFISSFWTKRQWIFEAEIRSEVVLFSIRPYRKRWYEYAQQPMIINSSLQISKSARLTISFLLSKDLLKSLIPDIHSLFAVAQIYHLEISEKPIFVGLLIQLMCEFSELVTLKIFSLLLLQTRNRYNEEEIESFVSKLVKNKITKVYLEKMFKINEIYFLIMFCPRMNYLQVNCINNMNVELFVKDILMKIKNEYNGCLRLLVFRVTTADDKMVQKLEKMINCKKLLINYTIKRVLDQIYLQWT